MLNFSNLKRINNRDLENQYCLDILNLLDPSDVKYNLADDLVIDEQETITIICHGSPNKLGKIIYAKKVIVGSEILTIENLAEIIANLNRPFKEIVLLACDAGKNGKQNVAQKLADMTGITVSTPISKVWITSDNGIYVN